MHVKENDVQAFVLKQSVYISSSKPVVIEPLA
jgi:hypothetical protein